MRPGSIRRMISRAFLRLDSASQEDMLTDAAVHVLAEEGTRGLTVRAVAAWLRVTPQRVSQMVSREQLPVVVAARFSQRWTDWTESRCRLDGGRGLLPEEPDELPGVRVWSALNELGRADHGVAELLELARQRERLMTRVLFPGLTDPDLTILLATVDGLRLALCAPAAAVSTQEAGSALARLLELLAADQARAA